MYAYLVPMLVFQSVLFVLAMFKAVHVAYRPLDTPRVVSVLLRDSMAYFGSILAVFVVNLTIWTAARVCRNLYILDPARSCRAVAAVSLFCRHRVSWNEALAIRDRASVLICLFTQAPRGGTIDTFVQTTGTHISEIQDHLRAHDRF